MSVLVTGGAGYIGSHTVLTLLQKGIDVIVIDDFSNSSLESLERVKKITNRDIKVYKGDVADLRLLNLIFSNHDIHTVIHFAGSKSVGESISKPIHYYNNNVVASLVLINEMMKRGIYNLIFSSSATVYGNSNTMPVTENAPIGMTTNPYGTSKLMIEKILDGILTLWVLISLERLVRIQMVFQIILCHMFVRWQLVNINKFQYMEEITQQRMALVSVIISM